MLGSRWLRGAPGIARRHSGITRRRQSIARRKGSTDAPSESFDEVTANARAAERNAAVNIRV
jgi:hypothetical protein